MAIHLKGNGLRFEYIDAQLNKFEALNSQFKTMSDSNQDDYTIWVGEGQPDSNTKIWIKKTNTDNYQQLILELKQNLEEMPQLEFVGVDNFNLIKIAPLMCILMSRENTIRTFQNPDDLNFYILNTIGVESF